MKMKCGVCRYPDEIRVEYFQTPQYFPYNPRPVEITDEAIAIHRALEKHYNIRPNIPEDYGMPNENYEQFNSPEEHLKSIKERWPKYEELLKLKKSDFNDLERYLATAAHREWAERQDRLAVNLAIDIFRKYEEEAFDPAI